MLWALLLAGGGLLIAGPVGAIIGLLIGVVVALMAGRKARILADRVGGDGPQANDNSFVGGIAALAIVFCLGWALTKADDFLHPEKARAEAAAESAKAAEDARVEADKVAATKIQDARRQQQAEADRALSEARSALYAAQAEANAHYPQTDADIPEYESHWLPREKAARTRYERAYQAANGRSAEEGEADAMAWAAAPYTEGR